MVTTQLERIVSRQTSHHGFCRQLRVQSLHGLPGRQRLGAPHVGLTMNHLSLQIRLVHDVVVDDGEVADPGGSQIQQHR